MPLPSLVTVAVPAADCRVGCLLQPPVFSALSWSLPHHGLPPSCPFLASLSPRPGHSSSAAASFLLTLCLQDFLPSICMGWGRGRGAGEGFLPSSSTSPSPAKPCVLPAFVPHPGTFYPGGSSPPHPHTPPNTVIFPASFRKASLRAFEAPPPHPLALERVSGMSFPICAPLRGLGFFTFLPLSCPPTRRSLSKWI